MCFQLHSTSTAMGRPRHCACLDGRLAGTALQVGAAKGDQTFICFSPSSSHLTPNADLQPVCCHSSVLILMAQAPHCLFSAYIKSHQATPIPLISCFVIKGKKECVCLEANEKVSSSPCLNGKPLLLQESWDCSCSFSQIPHPK